MSLQRIERTSIWKSTLGVKEVDEFHVERERLRSAFFSFRKNVELLVNRIATAIPDLTIHDISHLDALWETANLIIGDKFQLTPLEGFILGGSFLLHDSALCFEAFTDGQKGLRETKQWKDAFADLKESTNLNTLLKIEEQADFIALRNLHAYQAERLLEFKWVDSNKKEFYLLEDQELRNHLGSLIGKISSSHHWDIEKVISSFNSQQNVPVEFPTEWRIDPIKIACILRCADAAHIDNERAPDFLHALLKRSGLSLNHWKAQNKLSKVDIEQTDIHKSTLLFTSTIDFEEEDSEAWFVAYDAICLINKEIESSNSVLEARSGITFQIKRVKGIESPESMSHYIKAKGWKPCGAKVHVGNIEKIIHTLAGEMLYGTGSDTLGIGLRELIQNSRDSIAARSNFDKNFIGKIVVSIVKDSNSSWVIIEDNGIGMSERVLTGPLLDFGTSFWTSSLIQSEFPGLRSSKFKPVGKFGIGFYSVFMLAEQVFVASRNWDCGLSDINQLKFIKGFSLRPILSRGIPSDFNSSISTQIKVKLKPNFLPEDLMIEIKSNVAGSVNFKIPFKNYLASLCAGLDVPVFYKFSEGELEVHENFKSPKFNKLQWLLDISYADFQADSEDIKKYISKNLSRMKPIIENERVLGFAAIRTKHETNQTDFLGISTVGGLPFSVHHRHGNKFIGFIDFTPRSAKRESDQFSASEIVMKGWAEDQLQELLAMELNPIEKFTAASALCQFKIDPSSIAQILTAHQDKAEYLTIEELAILSTKIGIAFLTSKILSRDSIETFHDIHMLEGYALIRPLSVSSFLSLKLIDGKPENNNSILDCIYRESIKKGYSPVINRVDNIGITKFLYPLDAIILRSGTKSSPPH